MRTFLVFIFIGALVGVPAAHAATIAAREQLSFAPAELISGNLYAAGSTVSVGAPVPGDLVVGAGSLAVTGRVAGDVMAGAGTVQLLSPVSGDARIAAGQVTIADRVSGDLVVIGGNVHLLPGAVVAGDVLAAAGTLTVDGAVQGDLRTIGGILTVNGSVDGSVRARADERLIIGPAAVIGGELAYRSVQEATIADGARIIGGVVYESVAHQGTRDISAKNAAAALGALLTGFGMLAALGLAALVVWRFRRPATELIAETADTVWPSLGRGLVYAVLTPVCALLLLISVIGMLPGVLVLMGYGALWIVVHALAGILLGSWLVKVAKRRPSLHITWASALGGTILFRLLGFVPFLGWLIAVFLCLALFGTLAHRVQKALV